MINEIETTDIL